MYRTLSILFPPKPASNISITNIYALRCQGPQGSPGILLLDLLFWEFLYVFNASSVALITQFVSGNKQAEFSQVLQKAQFSITEQ